MKEKNEQEAEVKAHPGNSRAATPADERMQSRLGKYGTQGTRCDAVLPTSSRLNHCIVES